MTNCKPKKQLIKKRRLTVPAVVCAVIIIAGVLVCAFLRPPSYYKPLPYTNGTQVHEYLTHQLAPDFFSKIQLDKPFEIVIAQKELNEMLVDRATMGFDWPARLGGTAFSAPSIVFSEKTLAMMGRIEYGPLTTVVTILAKPVFDEKGILKLNIQQVRAGRVNITALAAVAAKHIFNQQLADNPKLPWLGDLAGACLKNKSWEPVFDVNDGKRIRLTGLDLQAGKLVLRFEPVSKP